MKRFRLLSAVAALLLATASLSAQTLPPEEKIQINLKVKQTIRTIQQDLIIMDLYRQTMMNLQE